MTRLRSREDYDARKGGYGPVFFCKAWHGTFNEGEFALCLITFLALVVG